MKHTVIGLIALGLAASAYAAEEKPATPPAGAAAAEVKHPANVKQIGQDEFAKEVEQAKGVVIVDFFATWCPPCKKLAKDMPEVAAKYPNISVVKIDTDKNQDLAKKFKVQAIPYVVVFKDGKKVGEMVGYGGKDKLEALFKDNSK